MFSFFKKWQQPEFPFSTGAWVKAKNTTEWNKALTKPYSPRKDEMGIIWGRTKNGELISQTHSQESLNRLISGGKWGKRMMLACMVASQKFRQGSMLYCFDKGHTIFPWMLDECLSGEQNLKNPTDYIHVDLKDQTLGWWCLGCDHLAYLIMRECEEFGDIQHESFAIAYLIFLMRDQYSKNDLLNIIERRNLIDGLQHNVHFQNFSDVGGQAKKINVLAILTKMHTWKILNKRTEEQLFRKHTFFSNCEGKDAMVLGALGHYWGKQLGEPLLGTYEDVIEQRDYKTRTLREIIFFDPDATKFPLATTLLAQFRALGGSLSYFIDKHPKSIEMGFGCRLELSSTDKPFSDCFYEHIYGKTFLPKEEKFEADGLARTFEKRSKWGWIFGHKINTQIRT